jgi:hypothetical protein
MHALIMALELFGGTSVSANLLASSVKETKVKDPKSPKVAKAEAKRKKRAAKMRNLVRDSANKEESAQITQSVVQKDNPGVQTSMATIHGQTVEVKRYPAVQSNPEYYWDRQKEINKHSVKRNRMF